MNTDELEGGGVVKRGGIGIPNRNFDYKNFTVSQGV